MVEKPDGCLSSVQKTRIKKGCPRAAFLLHKNVNSGIEENIRRNNCTQSSDCQHKDIIDHHVSPHNV